MDSMAIPPWPRPPADDDKYAAGNERLRKAYVVLAVAFVVVLIVWFALRFVDALREPEAPVAGAADAAAGAEVAVEEDDEVPLLHATTVKVLIIRAIRANFMVWFLCNHYY